jgi:hypothetical protein
MDEVALERAPVRVAKHGNGPLFPAALGDFGGYERLPVRAAEHVVNSA